MARPTCAQLLPGVLAALAFILSLFGSVYCKFLTFEATEGNSDNDTPALYFGIWYYQFWTVQQNNIQGTVILETCENYPDGMMYMDAKWKSARAFSALALIIGGVVTFWTILAWCLYPSKRTLQMGGILYMLVCLFQGLTLLFLDSNACHNNTLMKNIQENDNEDNGANVTYSSSCSMAAGARCAIAATVFWFLAAVAALKVDPPVRDPITVETHAVTFTKTTGPDGTTMVSENVVKGQPISVGEQHKNIENVEQQPMEQPV
mmetsp:Transcript_24847/g.42571  ORF Transcript_24847/g.42571 Transcript_24847/m.42571 type:complete len:262 (-) Transcript_24847:341-1126(-)|eukprot:CAMPEP_0183704278 /NCGR_PEP_ID=MMETSP0737-20130205/1655_1 /TAXON_ID=385413 /ORGANISM="Thalassiosira miniscula, Strain CCMP1093" /LENGTH=261 /DNA_ID=CAMNT_0025931111 /DNA_START=130 /DNA_END=915 /DNA_ORIENTATION=+